MLLLIGSLLQIIYGVNAANEGLIFVQAVWRHGDRAPSKLPYPNDPHGESSWPRGWSQLTNLGMQQMYDLGQFFRRRYGTFVGEDFNLNDVLIRSSSSDRAIVSAQAMLRGFYPANKQTMWLQGELWQPLPFSSVTPGQSDPMLRPTDYSCPTYDTAMQSLGQIAASINSEYADVFEFLVNVTGYNKVEFKQALTLSNIKREVLHNMSQPYWVYEKWPSHGNRTTLQILEKIKRIDRINEFNSSTKAKLRGGLLATDWLNRAINVSLGQQKTPKKMMLFSAHDGTVLALMYALNIGNDLLAPYASCLIMELYRTANNETEVKVS
ncbi:unnamed protein product [Toxocara canis]|uniref:Lysosomal acid phosphatase n=1 Tax=Toxocara canis TaxID=6265 RepID=A0A183UYW9_TOXCA|nr:unnamed protein product [Toxocara canis]